MITQHIRTPFTRQDHWPLIPGVACRPSEPGRPHEPKPSKETPNA